MVVALRQTNRTSTDDVQIGRVACARSSFSVTIVAVILAFLVVGGLFAFTGEACADEELGQGASASENAAGKAFSQDDNNSETGAVSVDLPDGTYSIEVDLSGGSGRASVSTPTWMVVEDGSAYARLLWSSPYYDYMIVEGQRYDNETDDGSNSTFTIPILAMDEEIPIVADTTAMGDPVEIEYNLTFYSTTVDDVSAIPQEAAIKVLEMAIVIIVIGGIANYVLKRRRKQ